MHARKHRTKRRALFRFAGSEAHRTVSSTVKRALKGNQIRSGPVELRTNLIAPSTASVPELVKKDTLLAVS